MGDKEARWEFPAGHIEDGDTALATAKREWEEETQTKFPRSAEQVGTWISEDGEFQGFVFRIQNEDEIEFGKPDGEEISAVAWWDIDDLDDDKVREKVREGLDRAEPILERAEKASYDHFHRKADRLVGHYAPQVKEAMAQVLQADAISQATRAAYTAEKGLPHSPHSRNVPQYSQALYNLMGGAHDLLGQVNTEQLEDVITRLYKDAMREGTREAQKTLVVKAWHPGKGQKFSSPKLEDLLRNAGVVVRGIAETEVKRIGEAIQRGLEEDWTLDQITAAVDAIVHDPDRAMMIAETEYSRAATAAHREVYVRNGVTHVQWLHKPGACEACMENARVSPIPITSTWPSGDVPVHPWCRCAEAPYVGG
jgi:ADP-ribose pyrophosphatase YjhB (NUDIX family)